MKNEKAFLVAERMIDYYYKKQRDEYLRDYEWIQTKKSLRNGKRHLVKSTIAAILLIVLCLQMIYLDIQVRQRIQNIGKMQAQILQMEYENTEALKRVKGIPNYDEVRKKAFDMGMIVVDKDRVVYYEVKEEDYMVQMEEIPPKE